MKPLTIDELKALEVGDWLWIEILHDSYRPDEVPYGKYYKILSNSNYFRLFVNIENFEYKFPYSEYEETWLAYKNKEQTQVSEDSRIISNKEFWELSNRYTQKELDERIEFAKKKVVEDLNKNYIYITCPHCGRKVIMDWHCEKCDNKLDII